MFITSSTVYSDGKTDCDPPLTPDKNFLICPGCNKAFWKDDAITNDDESEIPENELPQALDINDLYLVFETDYQNNVTTYYLDLLERGFANTSEREQSLRIELWHILNNANRNESNNFFDNLKSKVSSGFQKHDLPTGNGKNEKSNINSIFKKNLERLISIFNPENDDELLLFAEMHREIREYTKALEVLSEINEVPNNTALKEIRRATKARNSKVFIIKNN